MNKDKEKEKEDKNNTTILEEWRDIPSCPGYQVSNLGRVRGKLRIINNNGRLFYKKPALCKPQVEKDGYVFVRINPQGKFAIKDKEGKAKTRKYYVHILVAEAFIGPIPFKGAQVDHIDRNRSNNRYDNLRYVTRLENAQNRVLDIRYGERCNFSKLKKEEVLEIRKNIEGMSTKELAEKYSVSTNTIRRIIKGESWKD